MPPSIAVIPPYVEAAVPPSRLPDPPPEESAKDKTPEPLVCKTWFALPSEDGRVYALDILILPEPDVVSVKSALLGAAIVEPTISKSPTEILANDNVPDPFVCKTCPDDPSEVGSVSPENVKAPVTSSASAIVIFDESAALKVVPFTVTASRTMLPVPDVVNVKSAFVGATKFVMEISPSAPNSNAEPAAFTFRTCPAEPIELMPVPPFATGTVSPDWNYAIPVATLDALKTTRTGVLSAIYHSLCAPLSCRHGMHSGPLSCRYLSYA